MFLIFLIFYNIKAGLKFRIKKFGESLSTNLSHQYIPNRTVPSFSKNSNTLKILIVTFYIHRNMERNCKKCINGHIKCLWKIRPSNGPLRLFLELSNTLR